jgi:AraC-like DNA-binding protein
MSSTSPLVLASEARTRVVRSGPDESFWEWWERTPSPSLAGLVAGSWAGDAEQAIARHRTLPNGELMLLFHLGPGQRLTERDGAPCEELVSGAILAGLQERPSTMETFERHTRVAGLRLLPVGAWLLLGGLPQSELVGRILDAEAVLGGGAGLEALRQQMGEARDLGMALELLEAWLEARLTTSRAPAPIAQTAEGLLRAAGGTLRIDALADATSLSTRRLRSVFQREVGVPPKRLARILRFRGALERLATAPAIDLMQLALECGYYDQAHLYRDFRDLADMTPLDYLTRRGEAEETPDVIGS